MSSTPVSASTAAHLASLKAAAGVSVLYARGGSSVTITAVQGRTDHEVIGAHGIVIDTARAVDWIVEAADLAAESLDPPARGDTITVNGSTYELIPAGNGRWYSPWDTSGLGYRLHTKLN